MRSTHILLSLVTGSIFLCGCQPGTEQTPASSSASEQAAIVFEDVTAQAGLSGIGHETGSFGEKWLPESLGPGIGFIDYNGDHWQDLIVVSGGVWPGQGEEVNALRLFRNDRNGQFSEQTGDAGLDGLHAYAFGVLGADYDNDGDADLFVTTLKKNVLLRNDDGIFHDATQQAGLDEHEEWSSAAVFFDADNDGWLDLYVGNYVSWSPETDIMCSIVESVKSYCTPELYEGVSGRFFLNQQDGTFSERTVEAGFAGTPGKTLGATTLDFNTDGWPDLVVANDTQRDLLFVNQGDGTFSEEGILSGIAFDENGRARAGMGIDVGVMDQSGEPTIVVGHFSKEMIGVYKHLNNGLFIERSARSRIGRPSLLSLTFGVVLFDVDLDQDLDVFAANGHLNPEIEQLEESIKYKQPTQLFLNDGKGSFTLPMITEASPLQTPLVARGIALADYDHDGDIDVVLAENGGPIHLWRNNTQTGNAVRLVLEGKASNRDGLGAQIRGVAGTQQLFHRAKTGGSYLSTHERVITLGLGEEEQLDSLIINWPNSGNQLFTHVDAGTTWYLVEGESQLVPLPTAQY